MTKLKTTSSAFFSHIQIVLPIDYLKDQELALLKRASWTPFKDIFCLIYQNKS